MHIYSTASIFLNQNKSPFLSCLRKKFYSSKVELNDNVHYSKQKAQFPREEYH